MEKDILIELKDGLERLLGTGRAKLSSMAQKQG